MLLYHMYTRIGKACEIYRNGNEGYSFEDAEEVRNFRTEEEAVEYAKGYGYKFK